MALAVAVQTAVAGLESSAPPPVPAVAWTRSEPAAVPVRVKPAWPFVPVVAWAVAPASGPLATAKVTATLGTALPLPSRRVAVKVAAVPTGWLTVSGARVRLSGEVQVAVTGFEA